MSDEEARIRELAHQIWESEGKPHGQHDRHWQMACKLAKADEQPITRPKATRRVTKPEPLESSAARESVSAKTAAKPPGKQATPKSDNESSVRAKSGAGTAKAAIPAARKASRAKADADPATKTLDNPRVGTRPDKSGPGGGKK